MKRHSIIIRWYRRRGVDFVADNGQAMILKQLTGREFLDAATRELLRDLTGGAIYWQEVPTP